MYNKTKQVCLVVAFLAITLITNAQQQLTIDKLFQLKRVGNAELSPDGKKLLFIVGETVMKDNATIRLLYTTDLKGESKTLISTVEDKILYAVWRPDGKKIGYMATSSGSPQMWEMNPDGTDKQRLTNIVDGISGFVYSPDGNKLLYVKDIQVEPTIQDLYPDLTKVKGRIYDELNYRHWDTWNDGSYTHIFVTNIDRTGHYAADGKDLLKGQRFDSPIKPSGGTEQLAWSIDGNSVVYACKKQTGTEYAYSTNSDLYMYDLTTGTELNLTESNKGYDMDPTFSPDGKFIAYLSMARAGYESDKNRIMLYDIAKKTVIEVTEKLDRTTNAISWQPDGKMLYAIIEDQATKQVYAYDIKKKTLNPVTKGEHDYVSITVGLDGKAPVIVGGKMTISQPIEFYAIDAKTGIETELTHTNKEALAAIKMGRVEKRMIKATDGKDILTWVIYPPNFDATKKYPTLLYCQGGPQGAVSQFFSSRWNFQLMASYGYIVVAPNRRGLQSFGQEWCDAIIGDYGGQAMTDLTTAIDEVSKESYVDTARIGAVGASFGGYTVYWLAGHNTNRRFKSFIAHCGMYNMESWYGSTEEMFFAKNDQKESYWDNPANFDKNSPHNFAKNWNTPILVIHNEKDFRVPLTQGLDAFNAAQSQGIKSRFLYFPDENHWVLKPQNGLLWTRVFYDWLERTLPEKK
ncbi:MAG: S9 family peptidase [Bacteroidota bacterium]|nr:S9 family peptidase [Bacteroidota bacterium]